MSLLDTYVRNVLRIKQDISRLTTRVAQERSKLARLRERANRASDALRRATSPGLARSRENEVARLNREIAVCEKRIADLDGQIASKQKLLRLEEDKVRREEESERKGQEREAARRYQAQERRMQELSTSLNEARATIERLQALPNEIVVLFLASNPLDQEQLRLDEEVRLIDDMIRKAEHRDAVKLVSHWAVRPVDVLQAINRHKPTIVHFSGHGSDRGEIVLQDDFGSTKLVRKEALVELMSASSGGLRVVFFNTCYSMNQAQAVAEYVDAAIGMKDSISDKAARNFAAQFYSSIGFGHSVGTAFAQARTLLMMEGIPEEDTPELYVRKGCRAEDLVLVKANGNEDQGA